MTDQAAASAGKRTQIQFYAVSLLLIGNFLYRALVVADEYPDLTLAIVTAIIDAGLIVGLVSARRQGPQALFWVALICGIGLFAIRLHSDASWWTGHWHYIFDKR